MSTQPQDDLVVTQLAGTTCAYCDEGTLAEGTYKGDRAVICGACETPAYRSLATPE